MKNHWILASIALVSTLFSLPAYSGSPCFFGACLPIVQTCHATYYGDVGNGPFDFELNFHQATPDRIYARGIAHLSTGDNVYELDKVDITNYRMIHSDRKLSEYEQNFLNLLSIKKNDVEFIDYYWFRADILFIYFGEMRVYKDRFGKVLGRTITFGGTEAVCK